MQTELCRYGFGCLQRLNPVLLPYSIFWALHLLPEMWRLLEHSQDPWAF